MDNTWRDKDLTSASTALILIDVQNSFFHPWGGNYYAESGEIVGNMRRLLQQARANGRVVIHVREQHRAGIDDFEYSKLPEHCVADTEDAEFFDDFGPSGDRNEFLLNKRRMSAFFATDLDLLLRESGVKRLVIVGVKANVCVRATVQDAFALGYSCLVPRDAVNSNRPALAEAALEDINRYMGRVVTLTEAEAALS